MSNKIEKPKVFISYAWGSDDYQNKVLAFASQLVGDGIEVVFDKWDLIEGNDTYAFMEQCVTDSSITNVLMLLDPIYAEKADDRTGGVGTETQIISAQIYGKVDQNKFIPVIMERDEKGKVYKPTYLQTTLHFDLSKLENYDFEYQRLVKRLYGEEIYAKPVLGKKPDWVEKPITISPKRIVLYDSLKSISPEKAKQAAFQEYLEEIKRRLVEYSQNTIQKGENIEDYILFYDGTNDIKEDFLLLVKNSIFIDDSHKKIAMFFEEAKNLLQLNKYSGDEVAEIRIHELFLYVIAYYLKIKDYSAVGHLLGKTYFDQGLYRHKPMVSSYAMFYSGSERRKLDEAIEKRDNKNYVTGTGKYWIETLSNNFCSKEQLVLADLICFNYSVYGKDYIDDWYWFPLIYIYDNEFNSILRTFGRKMMSKDYIQEVLPIFGFDTVEDFAIKIKEIEENKDGVYRNYRHDRVFESAHLLSDFIKYDDLASYK